MILVDSHCHINFDVLAKDMSGLLERAGDNNVDYMLCVAVNFEDYPQIKALSQAHSNIFSSIGVHPCHTDCFEPSVEDLVSIGTGDRVVAIGETGLDYFKGPSANQDREQMQWQRDRFAVHIEAAKIVNKPLIIHTRSAAEDTMSMLEGLSAEKCGGVMHCFAESWPVAKRALDLGFYISFSGIVTFKNAHALKEVAKKVPSDRFLIETDSPYLAPVPLRGKVNEPSFVKHTAQVVAELRNETLEQVARQTTNNFFELFASAVTSAGIESNIGSQSVK